MNQKILGILRRGMTEETRRELIDEIAKTDAGSSELIEILEDVELSKLVNTACYMLAKATTRIFDQSPGFDTAYNMTTLNEGLDAIIRNPASINFTQTIILLTVALMTEAVPSGV